ncbi:MAG: RimK-like ATPgrasp N-terminal domain-containing protein [Methanolinea sp.]|nr:RimK-like ATPgrasp N-terminal domain-containing protein [Methanolinea sp.]
MNGASPGIATPVGGEGAVPAAAANHRGFHLARDRVYTVRHGGYTTFVSENYSYKSGTYYAILARELAGEAVAPDTRSMLDAFVVPVCLERARQCGIPVAGYTITHSCAPAPAIVYGLNYFASTSHFEVLTGDGRDREKVRHVTNSGKYPCCSQPVPPDMAVTRAVSIFGKTLSHVPGMHEMAGRVFECFRVPLVELVCLSGPGGPVLSSLCPVRYSRLQPAERRLLKACILGQVFL